MGFKTKRRRLPSDHVQVIHAAGGKVNRDDLLKMLDLAGKEAVPKEEATGLAITPTTLDTPSTAASPTAVFSTRGDCARARSFSQTTSASRSWAWINSRSPTSTRLRSSLARR
jgi:hypothetical protein